MPVASHVRIAGLAFLLVLVATGFYGARAQAFDLPVSSSSSVAPMTAALREFGLTGTVDCGVRSGQRCQIGSSLMLAVWTDEISGTRERVMVDVSWIVSQLDAYDQDDLICLTVQTADDGHVQAVAMSHPCGSPDPTKRPSEKQDRSNTDLATVTPAPTSTPLPTQTATATTTATNTATPSATIGVTAAATVVLTPTATSTATATATSTATPTRTPTVTTTPTSTAVPIINLSLIKEGDIVRCVEGGCITRWTITVTNSGPAIAHNVVVIERPGAGLTTVDTAVVSQGAFNTATNRWTIGTIGVGPANAQTATLTFVASDWDKEIFGWENQAEVEAATEQDSNSTPNNGDPDEDDQATNYVFISE